MIRATSDRKTRSWYNQRNTFGTLPGLPEEGGTCPGATCGTGGCRFIPGKKRPVCYVERSLQYKNVYKTLKYNTDLLNNASYEKKVDLFHREFLRFKWGEEARDEPDFWYRLHWSGDVPNEEYALALKEAMLKIPDLNFWCYTRSFFTVPIMAGVPNLMWYVSADQVNLTEALEVYRKYHDELGHDNIGFCYMGHDKPPQLKRMLAGCPVDMKKMPLERACHRCRLCLKGKPIFFKL